MGGYIDVENIRKVSMVGGLIIEGIKSALRVFNILDAIA